MSDLKPMQLGRVRPLLANESIDGVYSGSDADWDGGGYAGEPSVNDQWKQPVRVATTASITISTALNNGDTLDGVTLATGDRVLVKDQGTPSQNGIYIVGATPERAPDFDDDDEVLGAIVYVIDGTAGGGTSWNVTNTSAVTVGATSIVWASFGGGASGSFLLTNEGEQATIMAHGSTGATETIDPTDGNVHTLTLDADCTLTINAPAGSGAAELELWITQDGTGGWIVTWPGSVTVSGTLDTTASTTSIVVLSSVDAGVSWVAFVVGGTTVGSLDDLSDVTITTPTAGDRLRYDGSMWVNSPAMWVPVMVEDGATGLWYVVVTGDGDATMTEVP